MQETRQNKIARLLQKELSLIFQQQTRATHGVMIPEYLHRLSECIPQRKGRRDIGQHQCQYQTDTLRVRHSRKKPDAYHPRAAILYRRLARLY